MGSHWLHWKVKSSLWALAVSNGGVYCKMYLVSHWHVLISSYYLPVSNLLSLTALKSEEFTLSSGSFKWGVYGKMYLVSHWHVLISSFYLTVLNGLSLTTLKSEEFTLSSGSFNWGRYIIRCTWCHTDISLYLPITWLFRICSHWLHWKVKSSLWALAVSNGGVYCKMYLVSHWHFLISSYYLPVSNLLSLTALKSEEFTLSSGSFKWGVYCKMYLCHTDMSLYLPIIWLFQMGSHWLHWKVKSSLWALAVSNGGVYCKMYLVSHWHVLISSYYLPVSNLLSLTALKSEEFTLSSGSFKWGVYVRCTWCHTDMSLYLLFIWLFWMGSHWPHWKVKSSLWALAVSTGGGIS